MSFEGLMMSFYAGDSSRPTFFELLATDQLRDSLLPAVQFALDVGMEHGPPRLRVLLAHGETAYRLLIAALEWYFLRVHSASFIEHFFGLQRHESTARVKLSPLEEVELQRRRSKRQSSLTLRQRVGSLAFLCLVPELRVWCERRYREAEEVPAAERSAQQRFWLRAYPFVHALKAISFVYRFRYLLELSDVSSPALHLLGLRMARQPPPPPPVEHAGLSDRLTAFAGLMGSSAFWSVVYGFQFMQWWYNRQHLLQPFQPTKVPAPPPARDPYQEGPKASGSSGPRLLLLPSDRTACPLCHRPRTNPSLSVSGYAFCYPCILSHVQRFRHCPVTGRPMKTEQIRRIRE